MNALKNGCIAEEVSWIHYLVVLYHISFIYNKKVITVCFWLYNGVDYSKLET